MVERVVEFVLLAAASKSLLAESLERGVTALVAGLAVHDGASTHDAGVDRARDAVALLHVQLREREALAVDGRGLGHVTSRGGVQHVADDEALDRLVLRRQTAAVVAVDRGGAATSVLRAARVAALERHTGRTNKVQ